EELGEILRIRIVRKFRFLGGVQVVKRAVKLVEAVDGWKMLVPVTKMVLAELGSGVALRLEQLGDGHVAVLQSLRSAGHADLGVAGAETALAGDERGAAGRATLLGVRVGESHPFVSDAVNVRRSVAHQAVRVDTEVGLADVVAPDDYDVGF